MDIKSIINHKSIYSAWNTTKDDYRCLTNDNHSTFVTEIEMNEYEKLKDGK
jgi:hypothetical protein